VKAKLSARIVDGQDPTHVRKIVTEHLERVAPAGVVVAI